MLEKVRMISGIRKYRFRAWDQFEYWRYGHSTCGAIIIEPAEREIIDAWLAGVQALGSADRETALGLTPRPRFGQREIDIIMSMTPRPRSTD
jgi:hypothetical protein